MEMNPRTGRAMTSAALLMLSSCPLYGKWWRLDSENLLEFVHEHREGTRSGRVGGFGAGVA